MPVILKPFLQLEMGDPEELQFWTAQESLQRRLAPTAKLEALGHNTPEARCTTAVGNAFVTTVGLAYAKHLPLAFGPDDVWLCCIQGLAIHINQNAEELRDRFVKHQGKKLISVRRDGFKRHDPDNDWPGCFDEFAQKIKQQTVDDTHDLIVANFTTTGSTERAAQHVTLMDAMQQYFTYQIMTISGFPLIAIQGDKEDWQEIRRRVEQFTEFGLAWWTTGLLQVLDNIVNTFEGAPDPYGFWKSLYREGGDSGGPYVDGWINQFFPYLSSRKPEGFRQNPCVLDTQFGASVRGGVTVNSFPSGLASAPFVWLYGDQQLQYRFVAGFVGTAVQVEGLLQPMIGWGVVDEEPNE